MVALGEVALFMVTGLLLLALLSNSAESFLTMLLPEVGSCGDLRDGSDVLAGLGAAGDDEAEELEVVSPLLPPLFLLLNDSLLTRSGLGLGDNTGGFWLWPRLWLESEK